MTALHLPTAYFIAGILYLIMPIFVWVILRKQRDPSNSLWCLGGLSFGLSLILLGMRDKAPHVLTHSIALWLLVLGSLLRISALRCILQKSTLLPGLVLLSFVFFGGYFLFDEVWGAADWRFIWSNACAAAAMVWLAVTSREIDRHNSSISARWIAFFYLVLSALLALRIPSALLGIAQPQAMTTDYLSLISIAWTMVTAIVGNIGFLGIFNERMQHQALESTKAHVRQEEAARLAEQIAQLDRRRSVGEIAASLAHELSQPLTNIYMITDRMEMALHERQDESLNKYFEDLNRNAQKAGDILGRIRTFIHSKRTSLERVELGQVIHEAQALIQDLTHNESVHLQVALPPEAVAVRADPVQLSQIFLNVLRNAIQATHGQTHRQLDIRVRREKGMAHITFTDNGPGLSAEALSQVGTAFFTTKTDGLGVGLSISKSIAQQHGGSLSIGNSPLGGAVVELQLPVVD